MADRKSKAFQKSDYQNLDNLVAIRNYFKQVERMDKANLKARDSNAIDKIMQLWSEKGELVISGDKSFGTHKFNGTNELAKFYRKRRKGISETFDKMAVHMVGAKAIPRKSITSAGTRGIANGMRHLMTAKGEGLAVSFSHDFRFDNKGKISSLQIHVGKAVESGIAPLGALKIKDMGKLAAMAWMVA